MVDTAIYQDRTEGKADFVREWKDGRFFFFFRLILTGGWRLGNENDLQVLGDQVYIL